MKLEGCVNKHYIQAITAGAVIKLRNTDSNGRPALVYKYLRDIYASEDAKFQQVKREILWSPEAYQASRETAELFHLADDGSDLDDDTTLRQFRKRFRSKKRKFDNAGGTSNQAHAEEELVKDDSDLHEPLVKLKSKKSKNSKVKRKLRNRGLISESSPQVPGDLLQLISVKEEVLEADELGCQSKTSYTEDSSHDHDKEQSPDGVASSNFQQTAQCEYEEPLLSSQENQICIINEISYEHLEDVQPMAILLPRDRMRVKLETSEMDCHDFVHLPIVAVETGGESMDAHYSHSSPSEEHNLDVYCHLESSFSMEDIPEQNDNSVVQVPDIGLDGPISSIGQFEDQSNADLLHEQDDLSFPDNNFDSYEKSCILLKTDDNLDEEQALLSNPDKIKKISLNHGCHMEDELSMATKKQTSESSITDVVVQSYPTSQTSESAEASSSPESLQPPERWLHPKRKAITPSSQERLCLALNSVELSDDVDQYKCNEKLFENQTCKKVSPVRLNIKQVTVNQGGPRLISQRKFVSSARQAMKKPQNAKGNLEGPRSSSNRSGPSTGCTSIQGCSESAIAFSQRQMHDMETLAGKLMNELNSLKDIVETKLLFEAYRSVSLKNDADEVKSAISNATKVEEAAQKWLTMMSRDCNRFCKIMKLTPQSVPSSKDPVARDRKKIVFADEAGGKLCHVKFFEVDPTHEMSDAENISRN